MKTKITELLGIQYPIIQGGMQWLATAPLCAAVSEAGGLGMLSKASYRTPEALRKDILQVKERTDNPFAVNIYIGHDPGDETTFMEFLDVIYEEKVKAVETAGISPKDVIPILRRNPDIVLMHKAPEVRFLKSAEKLGVDIAVIIGTESAGLPGTSNVTSIINWPKAAETLRIPVVAAGGVCDGQSFAAAIASGAEAVMMGTRFLMSKECPIGADIQMRLTHAKETDTVLTQLSVGNPNRVINNNAALKILEFEKTHPDIHALYPMIRGTLSRDAFIADKFDDAQISIGQDIGRISDVKSVKEIMQDIIDGYEQIIKRMVSLV